MEKPAKDMNKEPPFLAIGNSQHDQVCNSKGIVNRKRRILSCVRSGTTFEDVNEDVCKVKRMYMPEDTMARNVRNYFLENNDSTDDVYLVGHDNKRLISVEGANKIGPLCFDKKINDVSYPLKQSPVWTASKGLQFYDTSAAKSHNDDNTLEKAKSKSSEETISHVQITALNSRPDLQFAHRECLISTNEYVTWKTGHGNFDNGSKGDMYGDDNEEKVSTLYSESDIHNNWYADSLNNNRNGQTTGTLEQEKSLESFSKIKQTHQSGSDKVLVKFRGKIQLIQREDFNKILSKLKTKSKVFTSNIQANNTGNASQVNGERQEVHKYIERFWNPRDLKSSRNMHHSLHGMNPGCANTGYIYPSQAQAGPMFIKERRDFPTGNTMDDGGNRNYANFQFADHRSVRPDFEKAKLQAQRLFYWHAERYFSKQGSY